MTIAMIVAAAGTKQVIGKDGDLPWHFSSDLKYFKEKTFGHNVLMGRVTYESILKSLGKPLPGRRSFVLTRDMHFKDGRVTVIHDIAEIPTLIAPDDYLFIIGGAKIYEQTLDIADIIYLTYIDQEIEGDAFFPPLDPKLWKISKEEILSENNLLLHFRVYNKAKNIE